MDSDQLERTRVVNVRHADSYTYIGRGSPYGNPFKIGPDGSRDEVIQKYIHHLNSLIASGEITYEYFEPLRGKRLGCYCKPLDCHGDYLAFLADNENEVRKISGN